MRRTSQDQGYRGSWPLTPNASHFRGGTSPPYGFQPFCLLLRLERRGSSRVSLSVPTQTSQTSETYICHEAPNSDWTGYFLSPTKQVTPGGRGLTFFSQPFHLEPWASLSQSPLCPQDKRVGLGSLKVLGVPDGQRKRAQPWGHFIPEAPHSTTFSPRATELPAGLAPLQESSLSKDRELSVPGA